MQITNWKNIGDAPLPPDNSVREAAREEAVAVIAEDVLDRLIGDPLRRGEAMTVLTDDEYDAINRAYDLGPVAYWQATQTALRRGLRADAIAQAEREVDAIDCEDEADYYAEVAA